MTKDAFETKFVNKNQLICGNNLKVMAQMLANSIDTIITDPPYGLGFMGKEWDTFKQGYLNKKRTADKKRKPRTDGRKGAAWNNGADAGTYDYNRNAEFQQWFTLWAKEVLRIAKPGAMMLVFGGTRTYHRLTCAIEDAGWEIRDCMMWLYGSGFPKSHNISKAIDKAKGAEREVVGQIKRGDVEKAKASGVTMAAADANKNNKAIFGYGVESVTSPATDLAKQWDGYGTALKPAWEPIIVAMKPLDGTFAQNAEKWGVGGLWIDGGRIGTEKRTYKGSGAQPHKLNAHSKGDTGIGYMDGRGQDMQFEAQGRWPANLLFDEQAAELLDEQSGISKSTIHNHNHKRDTVIYGNGKGLGIREGMSQFNDSGGASRFFYCAKSSKSERNAGLEGMNAVARGPVGSGLDNTLKGPTNAFRKDKPTISPNNHPTVKPLKLMEYLCRLTRTPTGGIVLDPFGGSGTTALACINTSRNFILIEKEQEYCKIARARIESLQQRQGQQALFE